ncbi:copper amine oxidase N-terminal domain-containing protein [Thermoanaerobacter siderophilus]|nr:copper amine oxidase N-terminal domain-containing protein [Thermoanaerobacter siderophilus]
MFKKLIYFVITVVLIFSLLQISAFAKDTTITIKPGQVFNIFDYLKDVGDKLTVIYSGNNSKTTYKVLEKGADEKGNYLLCEVTYEPNWDNDPPSRQKYYIPYVPHKIGTVTYTKKNVGQVTEDMLSNKYVSDDIQTLGYLEGLYTDASVLSIDKINGTPIKSTQYWYFANFLPQSEREYLASRFIDGTAFEWPSIFYTINVNGKQIHYEQYGAMPYIKNGRMMIPYRALFELGFGLPENQVIWNDKDYSVTVIKGDTTIKLKIGNKTAYINGKPYTLDTAPELKLDRTFVPLRFVSEGLGYKVEWIPDPGQRAGWGTVNITGN